MMVTAILLAIVAQLFLVGGQLLLKRAMMLTTAATVRRGAVAGWFSGAIGLMTIWYFLWLYCKQWLPISYLIVFEGITPLLLVLAAVLLLREKVAWRTWAGVVLISSGIVIATFTETPAVAERAASAAPAATP